ncbi:MAG: glycosyltransferase [Acidobacteriota bacterium]
MHVPAADKPHLLSVVLEDYFQVAPLRGVVKTEQWHLFENRVEVNTHRALDLLDEFGIKATFFVLGWIADEMPEVVREVAERGHEIASKGYYHHSLNQLSPAELRADLRRSREALERASGLRVHGFRIAHGWFGPQDLWALDVLAQEGFAYDSSLRPIFRAFAGDRSRRLPFQHVHGDASLWELPLASLSFGGWSFPIAGGNYLRQFPHALMKRAVARWHRTCEAPFGLYFHVWELDPGQPRIHAAPLLERIRQYRNLDKMPAIIRYYLSTYRFVSIGEYLGLPRVPAEPRLSVAKVTPAERTATSASGEGRPARVKTVPVTVIVPCYNESEGLHFLGNTLRGVEASLEDRYDLRFVFVDDGSADGTPGLLAKLFGDRQNCRIVSHEVNQGVAAAILTGIRHAETEIVCSMDCDCTYDPHQLQSLIPMLRDDVDMVTASPYHPEGQVRNVPSWRLVLSRGLSLLYRGVLHHKFYTYTSCFRAYRRSAVVDLPVREGHFLGVVEMLALLDLSGGRLAECPAVLEVRLLGRAHMKVLRTIAGHVRLLGRMAWLRVKSPRPVVRQEESQA